MKSLVWCLVVVYIPVLSGTVSQASNTRQKLVKFTSVIEPPFLSLRRLGHPLHRTQFEGFIPDLIRKVARRMMIPYTIQIVKDGGYGRPTGNGTWNGMIGEILREEATVAAGALSKRPAREKVVDFTVPFMTVGIKAVLKKPRKGRELPIYSIRELANHTGLTVGVISGSMTMWYFRTATHPDLQNIWTKIISTVPSGLESSSVAGIERVRQSDGSFVFLLESTFAHYLTRHLPCDLMILDDQELLNPNEYAFAVTKGSKLKAQLNSVISSLKKKGEIDRLYRKWWSGECGEVKNSKRSESSTTSDVVPSTSLIQLRDEPDKVTQPSWLRSRDQYNLRPTVPSSQGVARVLDARLYLMCVVCFTAYINRTL